MFNGNIQIRIRQCPVKKYNEQLLHLAETLRIDPTKVISNAMKLDDATKGYENFDKKEEKMKIVLYLNPENNPTTLVNGCKVSIRGIIDSNIIKIHTAITDPLYY